MQLPTCTPGRDDTGDVLLSWSALCREGFYFPNHGLRCQKSGILAKDLRILLRNWREFCWEDSSSRCSGFKLYMKSACSWDTESVEENGKQTEKRSTLFGSS